MKSVSSEININEYIKSKLKIFLETFSTLGEIIGGTSSASEKTDAELEAKAIEEKSPSTKSIKALEKMIEVPEYINTKGKGQRKRKESQFQVNYTNINAKNEKEKEEVKGHDDEYIK